MSVTIQSAPSLQLTDVPVKSAWDNSSPAEHKWQIPAAIWTPMIHPNADEIIAEVDAYFLEHWNFPNEKARKTFVNAGFSRVTSLYFPLSQDDRLHYACRLLTVLFLIDDLLEDMSFDDGEKYNENLITLSRGDALPDRECPLMIPSPPVGHVILTAFGRIHSGGVHHL